ncbi:hypothetical protein Q2941_50370 [Bradyrhizobium sp. UFLA05-153]
MIDSVYTAVDGDCNGQESFQKMVFPDESGVGLDERRKKARQHRRG